MLNILLTAKKSLTIFAKSSIANVLLGSKYAYANWPLVGFWICVKSRKCFHLSSIDWPLKSDCSNLVNPNLGGGSGREQWVTLVFCSLQQNFIRDTRNSRISDDIDIKVGPVTKLDKRNKTTSKILTMTSCRKIVMVLSFF